MVREDGSVAAGRLPMRSEGRDQSGAGNADAAPCKTISQRRQDELPLPSDELHSRRASCEGAASREKFDRHAPAACVGVCA